MSKQLSKTPPLWIMITREMPCRFATGKNRRLAAIAEALIQAGVRLECHHISDSHEIRKPHDLELWKSFEKTVLWRVNQKDDPGSPEDLGEGVEFRSAQNVAIGLAGELEGAELEGIIFTSLETVTAAWKSLPQHVLRILESDELESSRAREFSLIENSVITEMERKSFIAKRMLEKQWIPQFDLVAFSSAKEMSKAVDQIQAPEANLTVWPNVVPEPPTPVSRHVPDTPVFLFVGHLGYPPNQDGLIWFAEVILPLILESEPDAILRIIGQRCPDSLAKRLDRPGVENLGAQPTLGEYYASATAAIIPLRAGTGTRIKILEAFSFLCPVISTSKGADGLSVSGGKELFLADDPADFSDACLSLFRDRSLGEKVAVEGCRFWRNGFTREILDKIISLSLSKLKGGTVLRTSRLDE